MLFFFCAFFLCLFSLLLPQAIPPQPQYKTVYSPEESKMFRGPIFRFQYKWYGGCKGKKEKGKKRLFFSAALFSRLLSAMMLQLCCQ